MRSSILSIQATRSLTLSSSDCSFKVRTTSSIALPRMVGRRTPIVACAKDWEDRLISWDRGYIPSKRTHVFMVSSSDDCQRQGGEDERCQRGIFRPWAGERDLPVCGPPAAQSKRDAVSPYTTVLAA